MLRRLPSSVRRARVTIAAVVLASVCIPSGALSAQPDFVQWLTAAAAPALHAAAPTNDAHLAARETLSRGIAAAVAQLHRIGPGWLRGVTVNASFDPAFQPSYALSATQPLLKTIDRDGAVEVHGGVVHDASGRTGGDLGLRFAGRLGDQALGLGLGGAIEDRRLEAVKRHTIKAELRLSLLEVRASLFDEVPALPASSRIAARRLDGYDLQVDLLSPRSSWAWLKLQRSWSLAASGDSATTRDHLSLRPTPLVPLEFTAGTQAQAEVRSWFAQLRWRITLGG